MSLYIRNLSRAIEDALSQIPTAQPSQIVGYWANRCFWISEFNHLLDVIEGFDDRLAKMQIAQDVFVQNCCGTNNRDEFGNPRQKVRDTTNPSSRRFAASMARTALKALADRALDLHIASGSEYDSFVAQLRVANRD